MKLRRALVPALAATLVVPAVVLTANFADASSKAANPAGDDAAVSACRPPTDLLSTSVDKTMKLPGGASVRIWDTGNKKKNIDEVRIVAVTIPRGSLIPRAITSSSLSKAATPQAQAKRQGRAVVVINGGVFDPTGASIPKRSQILKGNVRKGNHGTDQGLALYENTRTAEWTLHQTVGTVSSGAHGSRDLGSVNWQSLSSKGISVYTKAWGSSAHPAGRRVVVVKGGKVLRIINGKDGKRRPGSGQYWLTARNGSNFADWLGTLRVGEAVNVSTQQSGVLPFVPGRPSVGKPDSLIGTSAGLVRAGVNTAGCGKRDETLRPRSGMLWTASGDLIVATVAGRPNAAAGGASAHQWGEYLKQLGAVNAVNFDGGFSTTLLVRKKVGGKLIRLDRDQRSAQRAVPDALTFQVP